MMRWTLDIYDFLLDSVFASMLGVDVGNRTRRFTFREVNSRFNDGLLRLLNKPASQRTADEIDTLLPILKPISPLFSTMTKEALKQILAEVVLHVYEQDAVIIRQSEKGDSFHVILRGSASVYVDLSPSLMELAKKNAIFPTQTSQPPPTDHMRKSGLRPPDNSHPSVEDPCIQLRGQLRKPISSVNRKCFGKKIASLRAGDSFGEMALILEGDRNASVIADEYCTILTFDKDLYLRTIKDCQEEQVRLAQKRQFIDSHPYFSHWAARFKHFLQMSLTQRNHVIGQRFIRQGEPATDIYFVAKGEVAVIINPVLSDIQHPDPNRPAAIYADLLKKTTDTLANLAAPTDSDGGNVPNPPTTRYIAVPRTMFKSTIGRPAGTLNHTHEHVAVRRLEGYAAAEKRNHNKEMVLSIAQSGEILGDVEAILNMKDNIYSAECASSDCVLYVLDVKYFDRLIFKRNKTTLHQMKEAAQARLSMRADSKPGQKVPALKVILKSLTEHVLPDDGEGGFVDDLSIGDIAIKAKILAEENERAGGDHHVDKLKDKKKAGPLAASKGTPTHAALLTQDDVAMFRHCTQFYMDGRCQLVRPHTALGVYYRDLMQARARARMMERQRLQELGIGPPPISSIRLLKNSRIRGRSTSLQLHNMLQRLIHSALPTRERWKY